MADDVLDFDSVTVHIDLPLNNRILTKEDILKKHQLFLQQCELLLKPNTHISLHIRKAPAPNEEVVAWFQTVFANGTAAAAFLGGSLLSTATSDLDDHSGIRPIAVIGALLFILLFLLGSGCTLLFAFSGKDIARLAGGHRKRDAAVRAALSTLSLTLQALPIAGGCCLFWVLQKYVNGAGRTGFGITLVLGIVTLGVWFKQSVFDTSDR